MASYQFLTPTKVKLYAEFGYRSDGTRARRTKTVHIKTPNSKRAAQRALDAFAAEVIKEEGEKPAKCITFKRFVEDFWWPRHVAQLAYNTKVSYRSLLRNGVMDFFARRQLGNIRPANILQFFSYEEKNGHKSLDKKYNMLGSIFSCAVEWEFIEDNPKCHVNHKDIPEPDHTVRDREWYNSEEMVHMLSVLNAAKKMRRWTKIMFKLAALVGMRESEIVGLRNDVINFKNNSIFIDRQLIWNKYERRFFMGPPKWNRTRTVYVPEKFMQGEFRDYVTWHNKMRMKLKDGWYQFIDPDFSSKPINLIFTRQAGRPFHPNMLSHSWIDFVRRKGLPELNFHGLRHSCLSYQMNHGAPVMDVQRQAGHSSAEITTRVYGHTEEEGRQAAANLMDNLL